ESLWSKAQKNAVTALHRYAETRDEAGFREYEAAIAIPLGDRLARDELEKPRPDYEIVRRGFLQGRNHPEDIMVMASLYRDFRGVGSMKRAAEIWREGDRQLAALAAAADRLRDAIRSRAGDSEVAAIMADIDAINSRITPLEDEFSSTLGEVGR